MSVELLQVPNDIDAERSVIGAALLSGGASIDDCADLAPDDFYRPELEELWRLLLNLHTGGKPTDTVTVGGVIGRHPIRGLAITDLPAMAGEVPTAASAGYYAAIVRDRADLRRVQAAFHRGLQAVTQGATAEDAKSAARKILDGLDVRGSDAMVRMADVVEAVLEQAEDGESGAAATPWPELDEKITGLRPGAVYTIGARTGVGKSVVGINLAWHMALSGKDALIFSLEMSRKDVTRRILSAAARVDYARLLKGTVGGVEWDRIAKANGALLDAPLFIDDRSSLTPADVRAAVRNQARRGNLGLVVVDYLQLMTPMDRRAPREQQVSECSRALKVLAGDLDVPVVMLSQLNRSVTARMDKHPVLSDLRESGSLEQDSDAVILLYRDDDAAPDVMEVGVAKNRFGPISAFRLEWEGHFQRVLSPGMRGMS